MSGPVDGVETLAALVDTQGLAAKTATEAHWRPEGRFRDLVDALGVAVYVTDAQGYVTLYNEAAATLWGRRPVLGEDRWCGSWRLFGADGRPMAHDECPLAMTLRENRPHHGREAMAERPDGTRFSFLAYPTPLRDQSGELLGAVNVLVDITDRRRAEEALRQNEHRTASMMAMLPAAVYTCDAQGTIDYYNPKAAELWGRAPRPADPSERFCGAFRLWHTDGSPLLHDETPMAMAVRQGEPANNEEVIIERPDGSRITVVVNVEPIRDAQGRLNGALNVLQDITERKQAELELARANALKGQFLTLVSDELRTPITTVLGNVLLLQRHGDKLSEESRRQSLQDMATEAEKLQQIIENLLHLTRMEAGRSPALEPLPLGSLATRVAEGFARRNTRRKLSVAVAAGVPLARGEETLVSLALENLLSNAAKYSAEGAPIEIHVGQSDDGRPEVAVRDHGIGLDDTDLGTLSTPFYRSPRATNSAKGMGLGLAVCRRAMEAQGGRIRARNHPDGGAEFTLDLPAFPEEAAA